MGRPSSGLPSLASACGAEPRNSIIDVELNEMLEPSSRNTAQGHCQLGRTQWKSMLRCGSLSESAVDIAELNISRPNVKVGGNSFHGVKAEAAGEGGADGPRGLQKAPDGQTAEPQAENNRDARLRPPA